MIGGDENMSLGNLLKGIGEMYVDSLKDEQRAYNQYRERYAGLNDEKLKKRLKQRNGLTGTQTRALIDELKSRGY